jgi:GGDEF domain-containing protein
MAFLKTKHHELILPLDLALYYDELEEISQETKCYPRSQDILKFIENVVYDRLLGENIQSFTDFQEYFIDGEISTVYYFDLKFIKEINDNLSYVSGDEAIMALWQKLKEATPNDMGKIMIARRGGTFLIGLRTGQELTKKTSESLLNINSILLFENDMPITVPIGQSAFQYDLSNRPSERESAWPSWVKKMIRNLSEGLNKANDYWYKQVYQVLKDSSELKQTVADSKPPPVTSDSWMSFDKLLWFYFHGKRAVERCHKMIEIIGDKDSDLKKIFEDILTLQG